MVVMGPKEREERRNQVMRRRGQKITVIRCILPYWQEAGKRNSVREKTIPGIHCCYHHEIKIQSFFFSLSRAWIEESLVYPWTGTTSFHLEYMRCFHDLLRWNLSSLFMLGWSLSSLAPRIRQALYLNLVMTQMFSRTWWPRSLPCSAVSCSDAHNWEYINLYGLH